MLPVVFFNLSIDLIKAKNSVNSPQMWFRIRSTEISIGHKKFTFFPHLPDRVYILRWTGIAQSLKYLPTWSHTVSGGMIDLSFAPHHCLLAGMWKRMVQLSCWRPRAEPMSQRSWISEKGFMSSKICLYFALCFDICPWWIFSDLCVVYFTHTHTAVHWEATCKLRPILP